MVQTKSTSATGDYTLLTAPLDGKETATLGLGDEYFLSILEFFFNLICSLLNSKAAELRMGYSSGVMCSDWSLAGEPGDCVLSKLHSQKCERFFSQQ